MKERVNPFNLALMTLLASVALIVAVSCGGDSDDEPSDTASGTGGGGSGGTAGTSEESGGQSSMDSGVLDGAGLQPASTGTLQSGETCSSSGGIMRMLPISITGICQPSGTQCPGGTAQASDCAEGLVCCIGTDQCAAAKSTITGTGFVEDVYCTESNSCPALSVMGMSFTVQFPMGCPEGQVCCLGFPEGGFQFEGGFPFEGGTRREGGTQPSEEGGTQPSEEGGVTEGGTDASTAEAGEQQ